MKSQCPCCGNFTISNADPLNHEICSVCYWENDPVQNENPDYTGGANKVCLATARENYKKFGAAAEEFLDKVRQSKITEKTHNITIKQFFAFFSYLIWLLYLIGMMLLIISRVGYGNGNMALFNNVVEPYFVATFLSSFIPLQPVIFVLAIVESVKAKTKIISPIIHYLFTGVMWVAYIVTFATCTGGV